MFVHSRFQQFSHLSLFPVRNFTMHCSMSLFSLFTVRCSLFPAHWEVFCQLFILKGVLMITSFFLLDRLWRLTRWSCPIVVKTAQPCCSWRSCHGQGNLSFCLTTGPVIFLGLKRVRYHLRTLCGSCVASMRSVSISLHHNTSTVRRHMH